MMLMRLLMLLSLPMPPLRLYDTVDVAADDAAVAAGAGDDAGDASGVLDDCAGDVDEEADGC